MEHGSLAYGADWCRSSVEQLPELPAEYDSVSVSDSDAVHKNIAAGCGRGMHSRSSELVNKDDQLIASCSFYDHQLRIWALSTAA